MPFRNPIRTFIIYGPDGETVMAIDDESGAVSTPSLTVGDTLTVYGTEFTEWFKPASKGAVAFGRRTSTVPYSTTPQEVLQLDFTGLPDRKYKVTVGGLIGTDTINTRALAFLTYSLDGTPAGVSDPQLMEWRTQPNFSAGGLVSFSFQRNMDYASLGIPTDTSLCLCVKPDGGTHGARLHGLGATDLSIWVEDMGPYLPDTGIDRTGGTPPVVVTKKSYTTTWALNSWATYNGDDNTRKTDTSDMVHGPVPGDINNNRYSYALAGNSGALTSSNASEVGKAISTALSGAVLTKVEVYLYFNQWYNSTGGTAYIRTNNLISIPATGQGAGGALTTKANWPRPGGQWVTIGGATNTIRGVTIGATGTTNLLTYGRANPGSYASGKPQLRLSYTR